MEDEVVRCFSRKLGISDQKVIKRAAELSRLAEVRCAGAANSLGLSGSAKSIICLEIAAASFSVPLDKAMVVRLSGMTKKPYAHAYKSLECVLGEQKSYSIRDLAVQFGCLEAVKHAENLLQRYTDEQKNSTADLSQPIFGASALYAMCRHQKRRMDKAKLLNLLGVKRPVFDKLWQEMDKLIPLLEDKSKDSSKQNLISKLNEALEEQCQSHEDSLKHSGANAEVDSDYEEWKRRIIESATAAITKKAKVTPAKKKKVL